MRLFARSIYALVSLWAALFGLRADAAHDSGSSPDGTEEGREHRRVGSRGEMLAYWYLRRAGYTVIRRNFRAATGGEVDLIGWDGNVLAFVEVKTRSTSSGNEPERAVHAKKQEALLKAARAYLKRRKWYDTEYRFDVLAIEAVPGRRPRFPTVRLHKSAFAG